jgi:hypothetical protein
MKITRKDGLGRNEGSKRQASKGWYHEIHGKE